MNQARPAIPLQVQTGLLPEDQSRADLYALLGRLFYAGPDAALLAQIASAGGLFSAGEDRALGAAWSAVVDAAAGTNAPAEIAAFDETFVGTGKARVTPYVSFYLVSQGRERLLVDLRDTLAALGLSRRGGALEPEDHIAGLCEVMRHLVLQGSSEANLRAQREFFDRFFRRGYEGFTAAIEAETGVSAFYRALAQLARTFFAIEAQGLEMIG
jgi:TorA maturation chaperone TorD